MFFKCQKLCAKVIIAEKHKEESIKGRVRK